MIAASAAVTAGGMLLITLGLLAVAVGVIAVAGHLDAISKALRAQNAHYGVTPAEVPADDDVARWECSGCGSRAPVRRSEHDRPLEPK